MDWVNRVNLRLWIYVKSYDIVLIFFFKLFFKRIKPATKASLGTKWWIPDEEIQLSLILLKEDLMVWEWYGLILMEIDCLMGWSSEMIYGLTRSCSDVSLIKRMNSDFNQRQVLLAENELLAIDVQRWTNDSQI